MKRSLVLCALLACGDDDRDPEREPSDGGDAGEAVRGMDAALSRVLNVGSACTSSGACMGVDPVCAEATLDNVDFPGGYCTASCLSATDCGPGGECPFGELVVALGVGHPALAGLTAGQCLESCTELGQASTCRAGYVCTNLAARSSLAVSLPAFTRAVCLPLAATSDGGASDASAFDAAPEDAAR